jgi:SAM-dependent methyltransferase
MMVSFGKTASDYRKHRAGFPDSFFQALSDRGLVSGSETVVDLGTGTGTVARAVAEMGCQVIGVDPSNDMLTQAAAMAEEQGLLLTWSKGSAESTGLASNSADVVTAGQCWHWFDPEKAVNEVKRILRDDGLLLIAHFDWLPVANTVVWETEQLIEAVSPNWELGGGFGIYPEWFCHLSEGGFKGIESFTYQESVSYTHEAWRGRVRASAGIGGSLSPDAVIFFDQLHKEMLSEKFPEEPLSVPHQIFVVYGRK